jgi:hypothetical protein
MQREIVEVNLDFVEGQFGQTGLGASPAAGAPAVSKSISERHSAELTLTFVVQDRREATPPVASEVDASFTLFSLLSPQFWLATFAVDTDEVISRLRAASWPFRRPQLFLADLGGKPDLYVPLWGPAVLVFVLNMGSNLSSYLHFTGSAAVPIWRSDFTKIVQAAVVVYGFTVGVPAAAWLTMLYLGLPAVGAVSLLCLYGYSIVVYVPAAVSVWAAARTRQQLASRAPTLPPYSSCACYPTPPCSGSPSSPPPRAPPSWSSLTSPASS